MREDQGRTEHSSGDEASSEDERPVDPCHGAVVDAVVAGEGASGIAARADQRLAGLVTAIAPGFFEVAAGTRYAVGCASRAPCRLLPDAAAQHIPRRVALRWEGESRRSSAPMKTG